MEVFDPRATVTNTKNGYTDVWSYTWFPILRNFLCELLELHYDVRKGWREWERKSGLTFYSNNRFSARKKAAKSSRSCGITVCEILFRVHFFMFYVSCLLCLNKGWFVLVALTPHFSQIPQGTSHHMCGSSSGGFIFLLTHPNGPGDSSYSTCFSNIWFGRSSNCKSRIDSFGLSISKISALLVKNANPAIANARIRCDCVFLIHEYLYVHEVSVDASKHSEMTHYEHAVSLSL